MWVTRCDKISFFGTFVYVALERWTQSCFKDECNASGTVKEKRTLLNVSVAGMENDGNADDS